MSAIIINAVSAYADIPVSPNLLKKDPARFVALLAKRNAEEYYLLTDGKDAALAGDIQKLAEAEKLSLKAVIADTQGRFVYSNTAAAWRAAKGKSPLPGDVCDSNAELLTVEDIVSPGVKTLYIHSSDARSREIQAAKQTTCENLLEAYGHSKDVKAVFFGFPMGLLRLPGDFHEPLELTSDYAFILTARDCALHQIAVIAESFGSECCGQCVFGYEGLYQIKTILADIANKKGKPADLDFMLELGETMRAQCLCEAGRTAASLILSAMKAFEAEIAEHITKKSCKAMFCKKFVTYHILADKCNGCMECKGVCDDDAIAGKKKFVHVIDQDECTQCGKCAEACEYGAVIKAGAIKPKSPPRPVPCKGGSHSQPCAKR